MVKLSSSDSIYEKSLSRTNVSPSGVLAILAFKSENEPIEYDCKSFSVFFKVSDLFKSFPPPVFSAEDTVEIEMNKHNVKHKNTIIIFLFIKKPQFDFQHQYKMLTNNNYTYSMYIK